MLYLKLPMSGLQELGHESRFRPPCLSPCYAGRTWRRPRRSASGLASARPRAAHRTHSIEPHLAPPRFAADGPKVRVCLPREPARSASHRGTASHKLPRPMFDRSADRPSSRFLPPLRLPGAERAGSRRAARRLQAPSGVVRRRILRGARVIASAGRDGAAPRRAAGRDRTREAAIAARGRSRTGPPRAARPPSPHQRRAGPPPAPAALRPLRNRHVLRAAKDDAQPLDATGCMRSMTRGGGRQAA